MPHDNIEQERLETRAISGAARVTRGGKLPKMGNRVDSRRSHKLLNFSEASPVRLFDPVSLSFRIRTLGRSEVGGEREEVEIISSLSPR